MGYEGRDCRSTPLACWAVCTDRRPHVRTGGRCGECGSMTTIADIVRSLGGMAQKRQLVSRGATDTHLTHAVRTGNVRRARNGWYSTFDESDARLRAVRVGGRLTGISLIAHLSGWVLGDHPLHVSVADNAARLRTQQNRFRRLDVADTRGVVVHWDDADIGQRGGATAVDILDALVKVVLDEPAETALACLDWALHTRLIDDLDFERLLVRLPARARWVAGWVDPACESLPESLARTRLRLAGHTVVSQVRLGDLERIDLVVDGVVALEVDGEEHHLLRFERDRAKDLRITCATFHGLRPSARMIFNDWAGVLAAIQVALRERGRPPRVPLHFAGNSGVRRRRRRQTVAAAGRGPTGPRPGPEFPSEGVAG